MTDHASYSPARLQRDTPPSPAFDDARERAIRLLTDGYAYDVISEAEFEWRLGQLSRAESPHAVGALVADLATPSHAPNGAGTRGSVVAHAEGRLLSVMSETRRTGAWRVPQSLRVLAFMSDLKIDLRYAVIPPDCTIDVSAMMATVVFVVPPGMIVDFDVGSFMATAQNHPRASATDAYQLPHVRIRGNAFMAEVSVKVRELGR